VVSAPDDVPDEVLDDEVPDDVVELATAEMFANDEMTALLRGAH
jgi:hypothetical protein